MNLSGIADNATKRSALILGAFYMMGFIVTNLYLSFFGIFTFYPLKLQYVFSGLTLLIYCLAPGLAVVAPIALWIRSCQKQRGRYKWAVLIVFFAVANVLVGMLLSLVVEFDSFDNRSDWLFMFEAYRLYLPQQIMVSPFKDFHPILKYIWLITIYGPLIYVIFFAPARQWMGNLKKISPLIGLGVLFLCLEYAYNIHPHINYLFGGGYQGNYDLFVTNDGDAIAQRMETGIYSEFRFNQAFLIYQDDQYFYFLPHKLFLGDEAGAAEVYKIDKHLIGAVHYHADW